MLVRKGTSLADNILRHIGGSSISSIQPLPVAPAGIFLWMDAGQVRKILSDAGEVFCGYCSVDTRECASYTPIVKKQRRFDIRPASRGVRGCIHRISFSGSMRPEGCRVFVLAMKGLSRECIARKRVQIREHEDDHDRTGRF